MAESPASERRRPPGLKPTGDLLQAPAPTNVLYHYYIIMASAISFEDANAGFQAGIINGPVSAAFHLPPGKSRDCPRYVGVRASTNKSRLQSD
jgi:hypothetical protein